MTTQQQRIAIAEFFGWEPQRMYDDLWKLGNEYAGAAGTPYCSQLPDYCNDLNAIAQAEAKLTAARHYTFRCRLWEITDCKNDTSFAHLMVNREEHNRRYVSATAAQRAEALLRTIGRWSDAGEKTP